MTILPRCSAFVPCSFSIQFWYGKLSCKTSD